MGVINSGCHQIQVPCVYHNKECMCKTRAERCTIQINYSAQERKKMHLKEKIWKILTSSHLMNLLPLTRLSATRTALSFTKCTPGLAPAILSYFLLQHPQYSLERSGYCCLHHTSSPIAPQGPTVCADGGRQVHLPGGGGSFTWCFAINSMSSAFQHSNLETS